MKPCPHKHVEARIWSQYFKDWRAIPETMMACNPDALICRDCGEWLGLGDAFDDVDAQVGVRAAEIAAGYMNADDNDLSILERAGWVADYAPTGSVSAKAGYLARRIAEHSEPQ